MPGFDTGAIPQMCVHAPAVLVEALAKAAGVTVDERAAVIVGAATGAGGVYDVAGDGAGCCDVGVEGTVVGCVKGVLVLGTGVDAFDDVYFAAFWPVGTDGPPGGPDAATGWHCVDVCDEKTAVVSFLGLDPYGVAVTAYL